MLAVLSAAPLLAQDAPLSNSSVSVNLPLDSPVVLLQLSTGDSRSTPRGPALMLDLHLSLMFRNTSPNRIHGVTLRVVSQEVAMGGVGSVFQPGLNVGPGEVFPVRISTKLMRPTNLPGALLQINLDGVLFQDFTFYGEDKLHSRRIMTASEMEAQRDRANLKRLLAQGGSEALKNGVLTILHRQQSLPQLQGRIVRGRTMTNAAVAAVTAERNEKFAFLQFPDGPIELMQGETLIAGSEVRTPTIRVRNRTDKQVKYVELGWVVTDASGNAYSAGSLPSTSPSFLLPARGTTDVRQESTLEFAAKGKPLSINKVTGFVNQVEFADGKVWIPNRQNMESNPLLMQVLEPSVEEERLADIYVNLGLPALMEELKKW